MTIIKPVEQKMDEKAADSMSARQRLLRRYLDRFRIISLRKRHLEIQLKELREDFKTSAFHAVNQNGGSHGSASSTVPAYILQTSEMEDRIFAELQKAAKAMEEIREVIDLLPEDSFEKLILSAKYITRMSELDICDMVPCSRMTYYRFITRGIDKLLEFPQVTRIINRYAIDVTQIPTKG